MISNDIILLIHVALFYFFSLSIFIDDCDIKKFSFVLLVFIMGQYLSEYGKCGLINIERYFLGKDFKNGFVYRLIKPVICYKTSPIYERYFWIQLVYIGILFIQLKNKNCSLNIIKDVADAMTELVKMIKK